MKIYDVVIVGAGVAGLAAAQELLSAGIDNILVLEGQNYVGGRVKTSYEWGMPIELGAEFIHGDKTATWSYVQLLNLKTIPAHGNIKLVDQNGNVIDAEQEKDLNRLLQYVQQRGEKGISAAQLIEEVAFTTDATVKKLISYNIGDYEAGDASDLDSGAYKAMLTLTSKNGDNYLLKDGYQPIIRHLARHVPIQLNAIVKVIDYTQPNTIYLMLQDGEKICAKKLIVTVSIGVLQRKVITFLPALPQAKLDCIRRLGMGNAMKLLLRFQNPDEVACLFPIADGENGTLQTVTCWWASASDPQVLVGYCGGTRAREVLALPEEELLERVTTELESILGRTIKGGIINYTIVRWDDNPFTFGAYSNHPVGVGIEDRGPLLAPIDNRLFLAGEAVTTNGNYATVHGAIESGRRVGRAVADLGAREDS